MSLQYRTRDIPAILQHQFLGFDETLNQLFQHVGKEEQKYPPYNVILFDESHYIIEIALAGFKQDDITINHEGRKLTIVGSNIPKEKIERKYVHRGIAERSFIREFNVAETMVVIAARFNDGILTVELENIIPESRKAKTIPINERKPQLLTEEYCS